jgi:hypothetical protein
VLACGNSCCFGTTIVVFIVVGRAAVIGAAMIVETRVWILGRLMEIGYELNRLAVLPPSERGRTAKALRAERRQLMHDLATVPALPSRRFGSR